MNSNFLTTFMLNIMMSLSSVIGYTGRVFGRYRSPEQDFYLSPISQGMNTRFDSSGSPEIQVRNDSTDQLPVKLRTLCQIVNNFGQPILDCSVDEDNVLNFSDIRNWTEKHPGAQQVRIICTGSGSVRASWPFKAVHLQRLEISRCIIKGFLDEIYNRTLDQVPDYLTDMRIYDNVIEVNLNGLFQYVMTGGTNTSRSAYCGSQRNINYEFRNNSYSFLEVSSPFQIDFERTERKIVEMTKQKEYICEYDNMLTLDQSYNPSRSKYSLDMVVNLARYPRLLSYNLSYNDLSRIPDKFQQLTRVFPRLRHLDISHNNIEDVTFAPSQAVHRRVMSIVIDLKYNQVKSVSQNVQLLARQVPAMIIDLRENPIACNCQVRWLRSYLMSLKRLLPQFHQLTKVRCATPSFLAGKKVTSRVVKTILSTCS